MNNITLFDDEKELLLEAIVDKVDYGGSVEKMNRYIRLFEKISGTKLP